MSFIKIERKASEPQSAGEANRSEGAEAGGGHSELVGTWCSDVKIRVSIGCARGE